jgi:SAM-dependent methyltransferase
VLDWLRVTATADLPPCSARDAYRAPALWYDHLIEPLLRGAKDSALEQCPVAGHMAVLDVGCGTGTMLERFGRGGCELWGIDASPAMLARARARLGPSARLHCGDAEQMPFADDRFDVVTCTMMLHELAASARDAVMREAIRVVRRDGRLLLVDYTARPARSVLGLLHRAAIVVIERGAGGEHWAGYRTFVAAGGLEALAERHGLRTLAQRRIGNGNLMICVAQPRPGG